MDRKVLLLCSALLGVPLCNTQVFAQTLPQFDADLNEVTVYRTGASLSHSVKVNVPVGGAEIVINNMAANLDESSIQVSAPSSLTIMSVRLHEKSNIVKRGDNGPEYQKRYNSLQKAEQDLQRTLNRIVAIDKSLAMLEQNQSISGANAGVNVTELGKMTDLYLNKQTELRDLLTEQKEIERTGRALIAKLTAELGEVNGGKGSVNTGGQLRLQVMANAPTNGILHIDYLTNAASWIAAYDIKAEKIGQPVGLVYKANVQQRTGLDWNKVRLSLSTGDPTLGNTAPILNTWFLGFVSPVRYQEDANIYAKKEDSRRYKQNTIQSFETSEDMSPATVGEFVSTQNNTVATTFSVDLPYSISANGTPHAVALKTYELPAAYKYYAVPRLDPDAFLLAEIADYEKLNLVPGAANILFENKFVGKTALDPYATQDTLNVSLGRDKRIVVKRETISEHSGVKFLGSSKKQTFVYEITLRNGRSEPIDLLLKDQIPTSTDNSIEVELISSDNASVNKETGVLTWKLNLKPGTTQKIRFSYSVKYPKEKVLGNL